MEGSLGQIDKDDRDDPVLVVLDVGFDRHSMLAVLNAWDVNDLDPLGDNPVGLFLDDHLGLAELDFLLLDEKIRVALLDADLNFDQEVLHIRLVLV